NYAVGKYLGPRLLRSEQARFLKKSHLDRTHAFFEKYGAKTIVLARFVPIVRTFAPFVAGVGAMSYAKFFAYNALGGLLWVGACVAAGYWFGGLEVVRENFSLVVLAIVFLSLLPIAFELWKHRRASILEGRP